MNGEPTFEDERFRFTHSKDNNQAQDVETTAKQYGYQQAADEDDLFPNKVLNRSRSRSPQQRKDKDGDEEEDLFPGRADERPGASRRRSRSPTRNRRHQHQPHGAGAELANRLNTSSSDRWVKGEALNERLGKNKKNRRKAADLF